LILGNPKNLKQNNLIISFEIFDKLIVDVQYLTVRLAKAALSKEVENPEGRHEN